jgi:hypothetical protein
MPAGRPAREKPPTHNIWLVLPQDFWEDLLKFYKERRAYNSYAEMCRHLIRLGLDVVKAEENGKPSKPGKSALV